MSRGGRRLWRHFGVLKISVRTVPLRTPWQCFSATCRRFVPRREDTLASNWCSLASRRKIGKKFSRLTKRDARFDGALTGLGGCPFAETIYPETSDQKMFSQPAETGAIPDRFGATAKALEMTNEIRAKYAHAPVVN